MKSACVGVLSIIKLGLLCYWGDKTIYVFGCIENYLFFLLNSVILYGIIFWGN